MGGCAFRRRSVALLGAFAAAVLVLPSNAPAADCCIYWSTGYGSTVGRADLHGFRSQPDFVHVPDAGAFGLAADRAHLYWGGQGSIGRVGLDGSDVNPGFVGDLPDSRQSAVAVDDSHLYWVEPTAGEIGRSNVDGTDVNRALIGTELPTGVALDDA